MINCTDGFELDFLILDLTYELSGRVLKGKINDKKVAIMSAFGNFEPPFTTFDGTGLDYMICLDRADVILSKYKPKTAISYRHSTTYKNAQTNGNLSFRI